MTTTCRLIYTDSDGLRNHLDALNVRGQDPIAVGIDSTPQPFLITLVGPYAEHEAVFFDSPWNSDGERTDSILHCKECYGRENGIEDLRYPVIVLSVLS